MTRRRSPAPIALMRSKTAAWVVRKEAGRGPAQRCQPAGLVPAVDVGDTGLEHLPSPRGSGRRPTPRGRRRPSRSGSGPGSTRPTTPTRRVAAGAEAAHCRRCRHQGPGRSPSREPLQRSPEGRHDGSGCAPRHRVMGPAWPACRDDGRSDRPAGSVVRRALDRLELGPGRVGRAGRDEPGGEEGRHRPSLGTVERCGHDLASRSDVRAGTQPAGVVSRSGRSPCSLRSGRPAPGRSGSRRASSRSNPSSLIAICRERR